MTTLFGFFYETKTSKSHTKPRCTTYGKACGLGATHLPATENCSFDTNGWQTMTHKTEIHFNKAIL